MPVKARAGGQGRVRTGRVGAQIGSGSTPGSPSGGPVFTTDFTALISLPTGVSLSRASTGTRFNSSGVLVTEAVDAPRFDYSWDGSAWVAAGLLNEGQRTNSLTHSTDLTAAGWNTAQLLTLSSVTGIDGTSSAYKLTPDTSSAGHYLSSNTFTTGSPFVFQAIVTPNGYSQVALRESNAIGSSAVFSLSGSGSIDGYNNIAGLTASDAKIKSMGNGRFLISCLMTPTGSSNYSLGIFVMNGGWAAGDPVNFHYAGDGVSYIVAECPQGEVGSFITSYIPTTTATVTRSADIPSSSSPLTGYLAAGPSVWEFQDQATGTIARTAYAAGAFDWPVSKWYRSMGVYSAGTDTSSHMTVGSPY